MADTATTPNRSTTRLSQVRADFERNTADHRLTVLRDSSRDLTDPQPYRHLRISAPGTRMYSWDIITWPGHLTTAGDIADGYTFARIHDMAEFFRPAPEPYRINPEYWAQKLAYSQREGSREFSPELLIESLTEDIDERDELSALGSWPQSEIESLKADLARRIESDFQFGSTEGDIYNILCDYEYQPRKYEAHPYRLRDHTDLTETMSSSYQFDYHLLLTMHAIVFGLELYRTHLDQAGVQ